MDPKIKTKFGTAKINKHGYYQITTRGEGNNSKYLHRLIYEDYHGVKLSKQDIVHHKDNNSLNNCILNLELMSRGDHNTIHKSGEGCSFYDKHFVGELNGMYGKKHSLESCKKMSKSKNSSGYFRVCKKRNNSLKQGFSYVYYYYEEKRRRELSSVDIEKLKEKVLANGLEWIEYGDDSDVRCNN